MPGGNDFGSFCANKNVVIKVNLACTFSGEETSVGFTLMSTANIKLSTSALLNRCQWFSLFPRCV